MDDHHFKEEENESVSRRNCLHVAHKLFWNVCFWLVLEDLIFCGLWTNLLARSQNGQNSCDKRLARLISYIHHTSEYRQYCYVGKTAQQCRLGLFQDFDFAGDLEDSKSTSWGTSCIFGSHTFVPISWMCKKQTSVSHSSTESEITSLDAGVRMDGIPALTLWDLVIELFHSVPNRTDGPKREPWGNPSAVVNPKMHNSAPISNVIPTNIDHIPSNTTEQSSSFVQYQSFQLHLLHQEIQLDKLLHNGEEDTKSKRRRKSCVQVATSSEESFFFDCDKFLHRIESDCIWKFGDACR